MDAPESLDSILARVENIMVETFDMPRERAQHYLTRWRADQHLLEGDLLPTILALLPPEDAARLARAHADRGDDLADQLERPPDG